jgi:hypothetical protein
VQRFIIILVCGLASSSTASADTISTADAERFTVFMEKVIAAVTTNADACPKMGKAIKAVVDANEDILKMAAEAKAAGKKLPKAYEDKLRAKTKAMEPGLKNCKDDKSVFEALERIGKKVPAKKS